MATNWFQHVTTKDSRRVRFEPEFIGRLPVRVVCLDLDADDLFKIIEIFGGQLAAAIRARFRAYGSTSVSMTKHHLIAEAAATEKLAHAGCSPCRKNFPAITNIIWRAHLISCGQGELVREPKRVLDRSWPRARTEAKMLEAALRQFAEAFAREHGLEIVFDDSALRRLVERAQSERMNMQRSSVASVQKITIWLTW